MTSPLYKLADDINELLRQIEDADGEMSPETMAAFDALTSSAAAKLIGIGKLILHLEAMADARKEASKRMDARSKRDQRSADWLRNYALFHMQVVNMPEVGDVEVELKRRPNPPSVEIIDESKLPGEYMRQPPPQPPPTPDKALIARALKDGKEVAGAKFAETTYRLDVK